MALTKVRGSLIDMADLDLSDVGALSVDSIAGDNDANTSITFSGSDVITIATGGSGRLTIGDGALSPVTTNQIDLGTSSLEFKDAFFDGTVTSDAFAGPLTGAVTGNADTATALANARTIGGVSFDGTANIAVTLAATATALASARTIGGTSFDGTANIVPGTATLATTATVTDSTANTNFPVVFHNESNGLLDDTGALRYNPSTGQLLVPNLTVAGTTTTVDTVTMEASNAIIFEGATADEYETTLSIVDPTADHTQYLINQGGYIPVLAVATTTAISSTPAELNLLDGSVANTVVNSKAVIYGGSGQVAGTLSTAAQGSVTSLGTLTALTVDDVVIDGKVVTMTGSSGDTAVLTVGTNGTLSLVTVDAAAAAANIQITADGTVDIDSAGILTLDSGAAINIEPAAGSAILLDGTISVDAGVVTGATSITSTALVGALTGNASTATTLATARTIGGVSFDGSANIAVTLAATATALASARTIGGTSFDGTANIVPGTATVATTVTITDNESTNETNAIIFTAGGDVDGGNLGLESDGNLTYNPSTGTLTATEVSATTLDIGGTNLSATATELNYVDGVTSSIQTQLDSAATTGKAIAMAIVFG